MADNGGMGRLALCLAVLALLATSCGRSIESVSDPATGPAADPTTTVATNSASTTSGVGDVGGSGTTQLADGSTAVTPASVTGAAASFSEDHLLLGAGSQFVPVDASEFVRAEEATWLGPRDVVLGVVMAGTAVAFPVMQMQYHHIANVEIAGEPYLVTY